MLADINQLFHERMLDAYRRVVDGTAGAPDVLFLALPGRLLGKVAYMCLDQRRRLYQELSLTPELKETAPYDRVGAISGRKLEMISQR